MRTGRVKIVIKLQPNRSKHLNSVNSEIIGRKFTKCVHDVAE